MVMMVETTVSTTVSTPKSTRTKEMVMMVMWPEIKMWCSHHSDHNG